MVPVVQSVMASLENNFFSGLKSGLTLRWWGEVWSLYSDTIFRSIWIALSCLGATLAVGVPAAYFLVKSASRVSRLIEELLVVPVAVPGLAIALALIINYGGFTSFRKSWLFILAGHIIFTLPFMVRSVTAVMSSINLEELEESAASLGAGYWQRFFQIALPNAMSGILSGALMVTTLSIGEFNLTWMLHTPMTKTLPVGLADSYASMRLEVASAYTVYFFIMIIPLLLAMQKLAKWEDSRLAGSKGLASPDSADAGPKGDAAYQDRPLKKETIMAEGMAIRLQTCGKTFGNGVRALEPLCLGIASGETVVILGPSGCGKTTSLRIIAGLETPDAGGRVFFQDQEVTGLPIEKRNVGMVFQSYALFPNMNVAQNVAYGLKVRNIPPDRRNLRVAEMLAMMKIKHLASRRIDQLSGGQKQRVALARAIAVQPGVLLMDEPLTALDAKLRERLRVDIDNLLRTLGITSVYVTHDQAEAMALGDRIIVMDSGRIVQVGTPQDIYYAPASRFVAEFIGDINRLSGNFQRGSLLLPGGNIPMQRLDRPEGHLEVYFRPENTYLCSQSECHFQGTVNTSFFLGQKTRLLVNGLGKDKLAVDVDGLTSFNPGEQVFLRVDTERLLLFS
jgi:putative spermidine/putrescine transport system ATP-binding protein